MYDSKARHPLSPPTPDPLPELVYESMWDLFVAIGDLWILTDDPANVPAAVPDLSGEPHRLDPLYAGYYLGAATMIADLAAQADVNAAYLLIYFNLNPKSLE